MASPRFLATLLALPVLHALWQGPVQAQELQGSCEAESLDIDQDDTGLIQSPIWRTADGIVVELDQDDTGLMQAPVRKAVEVTKARGIVGNAMNHEGGKVGALERGSTPDGVVAAQPVVVRAKHEEVTVERVAPPSSEGTSGLAFFQLGQEISDYSNTEGEESEHMSDAVVPPFAYDLELADGSVQPVSLGAVAELPSMPEVAALGVVAELPSTPEVAAFGAVTELPSTPEVAALGAVAELPSMPEAAAFGAVAQLPSMPEVAAFGAVAELPSMPEVAMPVTEPVFEPAADPAEPKGEADSLVVDEGPMEEASGEDDEDGKAGEDEDTSQEDTAAPAVTRASPLIAEEMARKMDEMQDTATQVNAASFRVKLAQLLMVCIAGALVVNLMLRRHASSLQPRDALSAKMRSKLERMNVATGPEIRSVCAMDGGSASTDTFSTLPAPTTLMRIQGRVVSKSTGPLVAPISGRSCVLYSASVSQARHDGVHQPPVAFDSAARDFAIQLEDCPEMLLEISSQDVFPFDMEAGRFASEVAFGEAPDAWRSFMLSHLCPGSEVCGANGQSMNRVDLGASGPLNFCECGLVVGSRVTCVGEVMREHNGKLRLCPWSCAPTPDVKEAPKSSKMAWLTPEGEPWLHKLMVSDDSRLILEAPFAMPGKCRSCS